MLWSGAAALVAAQRAAGDGAQSQPDPSSLGDSAFPYVNSPGLRLRDFPSTTDGRILATLDEGVRLRPQAATAWNDTINGADFPWYWVTLRDGTGRSGWVYGQYVTFPPAFPLRFWSLAEITRAHMNRTLLVLQLFRRLLGTEGQYVASSRLAGLSQSGKEAPSEPEATAYSVRTYHTDFGQIMVRYHAPDPRQLVLSISVTEHVPDLLLSVGDPEDKVLRLFGSDYYDRGGLLHYRTSRYVDTYGVGVRIAKGSVAEIDAGALVE
ncbi:MAG TPA: hypothetical protein VMV68_03045 [Spirochaetia bacterium]|nr:hypothetical protein [Spirochaetia bacterium]